MPPDPLPLPRFVAEPPREPRPAGRWAEALTERFLEAAKGIVTEDELGQAGALNWFPDRTFAGRTYLPVTAPTAEGFELYGYVSYTREHEGAEATAFEAHADYTAETAATNVDWSLDLSDQELASWRDAEGDGGAMTLVWGEALVPGGAVATAELGPHTTDQCPLNGERFTLIALDAHGGLFLEVLLWDSDGTELTAESLYEDAEPEPTP